MLVHGPHVVESRGPMPPTRSPGEVAFTGIAPGWLTDPSGRHEKRYWSGSEWTEHVTDGGVPDSDPPPGQPGRCRALLAQISDPGPRT